MGGVCCGEGEPGLESAVLEFVLHSALHPTAPEPWFVSPVADSTTYLAELTSEGSCVKWCIQNVCCMLLLFSPFPESGKENTTLITMFWALLDQENKLCQCGSCAALRELRLAVVGWRMGLFLALGLGIFHGLETVCVYPGTCWVRMLLSPPVVVHPQGIHSGE